MDSTKELGETDGNRVQKWTRLGRMFQKNSEVYRMFRTALGAFSRMFPDVLEGSGIFCYRWNTINRRRS